MVHNSHKPVRFPPDLAAREETLPVLLALLALRLSEDLPRAVVQVVPLLRLANVRAYPFV